MDIGEVCNREFVVVGENATLQSAALLMREHHIGDIIVVDDSDGHPRPVGILTDRDIVIEVVAMALDHSTVSVKDVMSRELVTVRADHDIDDTIERMRVAAVRRMPVVDANGALYGVVSSDDLIGLVARQLTRLYALVVREREREARVRA